MQKVVDFNDVVVFSVKGSNYRIQFWYMSKDNAISAMDNSDLSDKSGVIKVIYHQYHTIHHQ